MSELAALVGVLLGLAAVIAGVYVLTGPVGLGFALCAVGVAIVAACAFVVDVRERKAP